MSHVKTKTIKLTEDELENFRAIAEKYRVPFEIKQVGSYYRVTAPEDKIIQWGYDEQTMSAFTEKEIETLIELWRDRLTIKEMAWTMKKKPTQVYYQLKKRSLVG